MKALSKSPVIQDKLNLETAIIVWKDLQLYFAQGKLLVVNQSIDLLETAAIIASNNVEDLERLIASSQIEFASPDWVKSHCVETTELWAVVVSPYVITQLKN